MNMYVEIIMHLEKSSLLTQVLQNSLHRASCQFGVPHIYCIQYELNWRCNVALAGTYTLPKMKVLLHLVIYINNFFSTLSL